MGVIKTIPFEEQSSEIKEKTVQYWTKRAESFYDLRHEELESNKAPRWLNEIKRQIGTEKPLRILDVGCGSGFFEIILGKEGHHVTGIDLTEEMIETARRMISCYGLDENTVNVMRMDAESPAFEDETFDVVITRNVTWALPHPIEAYTQWYRILKKGGILLNFDAEYAKEAHHNLYAAENLAHEGISTELKDECHELYHMLSISTLDRPAWDVEQLRLIGFKDIKADPDFHSRVYIEKDRFYILDKMFMISARK